jgi:tripartite-type tricarboxylate transporter receptor subunit TctC
MFSTTRRLIPAVLIGLLSSVCSIAAESAYPDQPIKLVVGSSPGAGMDIMARLIAGPLGSKLNTSVIVNNRPGAGGILGADFVAKSRPDGYTILLVNSGLMVQPLVHAKMPYDTMKDLVGVTAIARSPALLVASTTLNVSSGRDFIDLLRANPGKYNFAAPETFTEVSTYLFNSKQGITTTKVPYREASQMMTDIAAGATHYVLVSVSAARPYIESGKVRAIGIASPRRDSELPDVPTFRESGMEDMEMWNRYGLFVPRGTPAVVIERLQQSVAALLKDPATLKEFRRLSFEPFETTVAQFQQLTDDDFRLFKRIAQEAGIKPD